MEEAEKMLRQVSFLIYIELCVDIQFEFPNQSLEWRRLYKVDNILNSYQPNEVLTKYFSMGPCGGTDKFGCPGKFLFERGPNLSVFLLNGFLLIIINSLV